MSLIWMFRLWGIILIGSEVNQSGRNTRSNPFYALESNFIFWVQHVSVEAPQHLKGKKVKLDLFQECIANKFSENYDVAEIIIWCTDEENQKFHVQYFHSLTDIESLKDAVIHSLQE